MGVNWTIKKTEHQRIDAFELWCWRRPLRVLGLQGDPSWIHPVHPKGDQSWIFIGRTDAETETPILWPPDMKNWLIWKHPDAGKYWRWEEKGTTEDEMAGWRHWLSGHEFEQAPGVGNGQGSLACCMQPMGRKDLDVTEQLIWTELNCGVELVFAFSLRLKPALPIFFFFKDQLFLVDWNGKRHSEIQGWPSSGTSHTFLTSHSKESHHLIASQAKERWMEAELPISVTTQAG